MATSFTLIHFKDSVLHFYSSTLYFVFDFRWTLLRFTATINIWQQKSYTMRQWKGETCGPNGTRLAGGNNTKCSCAILNDQTCLVSSLSVCHYVERTAASCGLCSIRSSPPHPCSCSTSKSCHSAAATNSEPEDQSSRHITAGDHHPLGSATEVQLYRVSADSSPGWDGRDGAGRHWTTPPSSAEGTLSQQRSFSKSTLYLNPTSALKETSSTSEHV